MDWETVLKSPFSPRTRLVSVHSHVVSPQQHLQGEGPLAQEASHRSATLQDLGRIQRLLLLLLLLQLLPMLLLRRDSILLALVLRGLAGLLGRLPPPLLALGTVVQSGRGQVEVTHTKVESTTYST